MGSSLYKPVKLHGEVVTLFGQTFQTLSKFPMDRSKVGVVSVVRSTTLFHRSSSVIVGIVRH
ncbi:MAG: hypothetical protein ABIQ44_12195 [Chloroflexia bacterium]